MMRQLICSSDLRFQASYAPGDLSVFREGQLLRKLPTSTLPKDRLFAVARQGQVFFRSISGIVRNRAEHGQHYELFPLLPKDKPGQMGTVAVSMDGDRVIYERRVPPGALARLLAGADRHELVVAVLGQPKQKVYYAGPRGFFWAASPNLQFLAIAEKKRKGWRAVVLDTVKSAQVSELELPGEVRTVWMADGGELLVESQQLWVWNSLEKSAPRVVEGFENRSVIAFGGEWIGFWALQQNQPGYLLFSLRLNKVVESLFLDDQGGVVRSGRRPK